MKLANQYAASDYEVSLNKLMLNASMRVSNQDCYGAGFESWMLTVELQVDAKEFKKFGAGQYAKDLSNYLYRAFKFSANQMLFVSDAYPRAKKGIKTLKFKLYFSGVDQLIGGKLGWAEHRELRVRPLNPKAYGMLRCIQGGAK